MSRKYISFLISAAILSVFFYSCSSDREPGNKSFRGNYSFPAEINGFGSSQTRVALTQSGDYWSYSSFQNGDIAGFYSLYGNVDAEGGNGRFNNIQLIYANQTFINYDIDYNTDSFVEDTNFYYFPWFEYIDYDASHTDYTGDNYGLELRRKCDDGYDRCLDFLWVYSPSSAVGSQRFNHCFSSLIIMRGEGFENPPEDKMDIKVVLQKGFSHVTVADATDKYLKTAKLVYLNNYPLTEEECRVWEAWPGEEYYVTDQTSPYFGEILDAYYVLVPTTRGTDRLNLDHIEIYDNDGNLRSVTNFTLYTSGNNGKILYPEQRYPIVIKLQEMEPTVVPIAIDPWEDKVTIEENRASGIQTYENLTDWILYYNMYISTGLTKGIEEKLLNYGDKTIESNGNIVWKFYINNNLDIPDDSSAQYRIVTFNDCLEGNHNTITGLTSNFIDELGVTGKIQNLNFKGLDISGSLQGETTGGLMGVCKGTIENCDIDGVVLSNGSVGIIAGNAEGANIKGCTLRGLITGTSTSMNGMFGNSDASCTASNNSYSGLIFQNIN